MRTSIRRLLPVSMLLLAGLASAQTITLQFASPMLSASRANPSTFVIGQVINIEGTVTNLKSGTSARVASATSTKSGCVFKPLGTLPSGTVGSDGKYNYSVKGFFNPENATGNCVADLSFSVTDAAGKGGTVSFSPSFTPTEPTVYTVTETYQLNTKFKYALSAANGSCSGESDPGDHPVGFRNVSGDLSFNIRSGPSGTECTWNGAAWLLPNGMRWKTTNVIPLFNSCGIVSGVNSLWGSVSTTNPAGFGTFLAGTNPNGAGAPIGVMLGPFIKLDCGNTLVNDKHVSLRIDSIVFTGPPGLTFP
jgi:hypothetical protein